MKSFSLIKILVVLLFIISASAYADPGSGLAIGVKGGLDIANGGGANTNAKTDLGAFTSRTGFIGGVSLEANLEDGWYLQPELLYVSKGATIAGGTLQAAGVQKLNYFDIPVFAKYKWSFGDFKASVLAGPEFGFLMSACETLTGATTCTDDKSSNKSFDFDITGGVSGEYAINSMWSAVLDLRYSYGLTNVLNIAADTTASVKNTNLEFLAGVQYAW